MSRTNDGSISKSPNLYELYQNARAEGHPDYEPVACPDCQNIYYDGCWQKEGPRDRAVAKFQCPGCKAVRNDRYDGELVLRNPFTQEHALQLEKLVRSKTNEYQHGKPLSKIVSITQKPTRMVVRATESGLTRHLGRALKALYGGPLATEESGRFVWGAPEPTGARTKW